MSDDKLIIDMSLVQSAGENLEIVEQDGKLILIIDTEIKTHLSRTGRFHVIGTSRGWHVTRKGVSFNLSAGITVERLPPRVTR